MISRFTELFREYLSRAAEYADTGLLAFDRDSNPMLGDELRNQYISYVYGCVSARILMDSGVRPSMLAGYSMGIYSALYTAGSISFETGLSFIGHAYHSIRKFLPDNRFAMCGVIGLTEKDIRAIALERNLNLAIVNRNSDYSFILAGSGFHINVFMLKAKEEGALHVRSLGVSIPYHTDLLSGAAAELSGTVMTADIKSPVIPLISVLGQDIITDAVRAGTEVVNNIHRPFNWLATQLKMHDSGIDIFTECGPSLALRKNSKFIPGAGKFVGWETLL